MKDNNGNEYIEKIAQWLEQIRFRKKFFGGISEQDVWKRMDELNNMYEEALKAERIRYDVMIEHYKKTGIENQDGEMAYDE
ncbi:MAG: hypothetical protein GX053_01215 [Tissierella sp.]|nr:hypothetical protein [Tissierella sp.]